MIAVVLMSRVPVAGATKTRLIGPLTPEQAAELHGAFVEDIGAKLQELRAEQVTPFVYLGNEGPGELLLRHLPSHLQQIQQQDEPLGQRMQRAFATLFARGFTSVVLFGADVPQLRVSDIADAMGALQRCDLVFGPTLDGGFYLVGMNQLHREVFSPDIAWGTAEVYRQSLRKISQDYTVEEIRTLRDIDELQDLLALSQDQQVAQDCPVTLRALRDTLGTPERRVNLG